VAVNALTKVVRVVLLWCFLMAAAVSAAVLLDLARQLIGDSS
jgi:hypothetical protein